MRTVTVCTQNFCPYCTQLKLFLKRLNIPFNEINLSDRPEDLQALKDETSFYTLPQVFAGDDFLGGYDNIIELHQAGKLLRLIGMES